MARVQTVLGGVGGLGGLGSAEAAERRTMLLDVPATVVGDPDREERLGWDRAR